MIRPGYVVGVCPSGARVPVAALVTHVHGGPDADTPDLNLVWVREDGELARGYAVHYWPHQEIPRPAWDNVWVFVGPEVMVRHLPRRVPA